MTDQIDAAILADNVTKCFDKVGDLRFSVADRNRFLADGKRLRGQLLNLISAKFNSPPPPELVAANNDLAALNGKLANNATVRANTAQTLDDIATLIGNLDKLLGIATAFV